MNLNVVFFSVPGSLADIYFFMAPVDILIMVLRVLSNFPRQWCCKGLLCAFITVGINPTWKKASNKEIHFKSNMEWLRFF